MANLGLDGFNRLPAKEAEQLLFECFAHRGWSAGVAAARPFEDLAQLESAAEREWAALGPADWLEAFSAHPRIGERGGGSPAASDHEQSKVVRSSRKTRESLARENQRYEERFGHVFLIAASGRTADDILAELQRRMHNDAAEELDQAAHEQRRITRQRLERMLRK